MEDAGAILQTLLDLYWEGLTTPLPFFPVSAMAYAHKREWNLERAYRAWEDGFHAPGEGNEPSFRLCFGQADPFVEPGSTGLPASCSNRCSTTSSRSQSCVNLIISPFPSPG